METLVARVHVLPVDGSNVLCLNVLAFLFFFLSRNLNRYYIFFF